jgi:hypothetical protein
VAQVGVPPELRIQGMAALTRIQPNRLIRS